MERLERGTYIGGQQIAAVLGKHPHMSIDDVFLRALYGDDHVDPNAPPIRRGRITEPGLISELLHIDEIDPARVVRDHFAVHPDVPFFAGTADAIVLDDDGNPDTLIEVTTSSRWGADLWGPSDTEQCAEYKWLQVQWYMGILGAQRSRIACLFLDSDDLRTYEVPRADDAIAEMQSIGLRFWRDCVLTKTPPDPREYDVGDSLSPVEVSAVLDRLTRAAPDGLEIALDEEMLDARNAYVQAREAIEAWEVEKARAKIRLQERMGEATRARGHGVMVTWSQPRKGTAKLDVDALLSTIAKRYEIDAKTMATLKLEHTNTGKTGGRVLAVR